MKLFQEVFWSRPWPEQTYRDVIGFCQLTFDPEDLTLHALQEPITVGPWSWTSLTHAEGIKTSKPVGKPASKLVLFIRILFVSNPPNFDTFLNIFCHQNRKTSHLNSYLFSFWAKFHIFMHFEEELSLWDHTVNSLMIILVQVMTNFCLNHLF